MRNIQGYGLQLQRVPNLKACSLWQTGLKFLSCLSLCIACGVGGRAPGTPNARMILGAPGST